MKNKTIAFISLGVVIMGIAALTVDFSHPSALPNMPLAQETEEVLPPQVAPQKATVAPAEKPKIDMQVVSAGNMVQIMNGERVKPLQESATLDRRALARAQAVCNVVFDESAHASFYTGGNTSILSDLSNATGENLARNFNGDIQATNIGFMASPTHHANIIDTIYRYAGFAQVNCPQPNKFGTTDVAVEFFTGEALTK